MGADLAYIGSAFIATDEGVAAPEYKQMIVDSGASDILYSNLFTGIHGNYLVPSIRAAGLDPQALATSDPSRTDFREITGDKKAWRDIWGAGQGIGGINEIVPAGALIARWKREYDATLDRLQAERR
jgi:nitronate monooxygenase